MHIHGVLVLLCLLWLVLLMLCMLSMSILMLGLLRRKPEMLWFIRLIILKIIKIVISLNRLCLNRKVLKKIWHPILLLFNKLFRKTVINHNNNNESMKISIMIFSIPLMMNNQRRNRCLRKAIKVKIVEWGAGWTKYKTKIERKLLLWMLIKDRLDLKKAYRKLI